MSNLQHWQEKIKEKRKNTDFNEFIMAIGSWIGLSFYKNNGQISKFPESERVKVTHFLDFEEKRDLLTNKGHDYIFEKSFFDNYKNLFSNCMTPNVFHDGQNENCDYADTAVSVKNAYLSFIVTLQSENVFYSFMVRENSRNVFNSFYIVGNNENIYSSSGVFYSFNIFYSKYLKNSNNIWFSTNLTGCSECLFCDDLQNSKYYIRNVKYTKEEYFIHKEEILKNKDTFVKYYQQINPKGKNYNSTQSQGSFILDSDNIQNGYGVLNMLNSHNILFSGSEVTGENCYDVMFGGKGSMDSIGSTNFGGNSTHIYFSLNIGFSSNIFYSYGLTGCSFCFGCVGLKNKNYCILNKQYTKADWEVTIDKIFSSMEKDGTLGNFIPGNINPLYFNDSFAYLFGNFTKEEVEKQGYMWRDEEIKVDIPEDAEVIKTSDLQDYQGYDSDGNWKINPEILKKVIVDEQGNYYKIVQMEYDFLVKHGLPLPELHWLDRMKLNLGV